MNYNVVVIISIIITTCLALSTSYVIAIYLLGEYSFSKIAQLIIAILMMSTFYAPIKHILLKYMNVKGLEDE